MRSALPGSICLRFLFVCGEREKKQRSSPVCALGKEAAHLAVPEKPVGLSLFLRFFDRCGNCGLPASAPGSGSPQFPGVFDTHSNLPAAKEKDSHPSGAAVFFWSCGQIQTADLILTPDILIIAPCSILLQLDFKKSTVYSTLFELLYWFICCY